VFGNSSVIGWGFGVAAGSRAVKVGSSSSNGNGAYLTTGGVWTDISDRSKKENITELDKNSFLEKILQLKISEWKYKGTENEFHIGPMAEDFHKLFEVGDDSSISSMDKTGVLFLGIQALSEKNDEKDAEIAQQQKQIDDLKNMVLDMQQSLSQCCMSYQSSLANRQSSIKGDVPNLEQNIPNPFDEETIIQFYLPASISSAQILVSDLIGHVLKTVDVQGSGVNQVSIHSNELAAGTYQYSLLLNGKVIDTKQMVLTK